MPTSATIGIDVYRKRRQDGMIIEADKKAITDVITLDMKILHDQKSGRRRETVLGTVHTAVLTGTGRGEAPPIVRTETKIPQSMIGVGIL